MNNLKTEFAKSSKNTSDEEVSRLSKEQPKQLNEFEEVMRIVKEILESASVCSSKKKRNSTNHNPLWRTYSIKRRRNGKAQEWNKWQGIDKHQLFKEKILNIKLAKFSGFNSSRDYYTFKDEFEKLHLRTTPKNMLPKLLRNNYLEDPPLS